MSKLTWRQKKDRRNDGTEVMGGEETKKKKNVVFDLGQNVP